jgi:thiol:disulfide interchange protein
MFFLLAAAALFPAAQIDLGGGKPKRVEAKVVAARPDASVVRPGETFKLSLDLEIPAGYHIYPTTPTSTGTPTMLVLEGVEVAGAYEEPKPKSKPKTEFLDAYEYHEGALTLTATLRVKKDAKPGPFPVKGVLDYQICSDTQCIPAKTAVAFALTIQEKRKPAAEIRILSVKPEKAAVKVGEVVRVAFEIDIPKDWHIYPTTPTTTGAPTRLAGPDFEVAGAYVEPAPKVHPKDDVQDAYDYHEGTIRLVAPIRLKPGPKPGAFEVKGTFDYQICSTKGLCIPSKTEVAFPLTVQEGQVAAAAPGPVQGPPQARRTELDKRGFLKFMFLGVLGGLVSLVMPCVYPLIPITLTYFVKQGAGDRRKSALMSAAYGAGIILVFTGVGFIFSLALGADGARRFASNPWVNTIVGLLFLWFTFSLFGLYDISLPQWLIGGVTGQRRSGLGGAFILGALFSIVTFTCTIPIASNILIVTAAEGAGNRFAGLMSMLVYSSTMAAPFFVLGLFPSLIKEVPKSGGWLHTVKVTAAFAELGLALSYFTKAEQVWGLDLVGRYAIVAVWVTLLVFTALYLLGAFRMKGDDEPPKPVGIVRLLIAVVFGVLASYMGTAFIQGRSLGALEILLVVPPEEAPAVGAAAEKAPAVESLDEALAEAKKSGKPVFLEFTGIT